MESKRLGCYTANAPKPYIIVREYVFLLFYVFLNPKNATFFVFLKRHFKKDVIQNSQNSKFPTLLTFHYMESPLQLKTMYVYKL